MMKNSIMTIFSLTLLTLCVLIGPVWSSCLNGELQISSDSLGFTVTYYDSYKVVNNTRANETYVLYCSSQPPNDENVPQNVKGFFQIPLKNVASFDRTTLTFLELLGVQSSLSYVADKNSITSPCLQSNDTIQTFSDSNLANVDAIFTTSTPVSGSKYVTISLGTDLTPLSNAEWIKFVSLFYDLETNATSIYSTIETTYNCTVQNLGGLKEKNKNVIAWVSYNFTDSIFTISAAKFHYSLMQQGGGAKTTTETLFASNTSFLKHLLRRVDFIIDETQFINSSDTFENWQRTFGYDDTSNLPKFITSRQVYRPRKLLNSYGYDDWSEKSYARPDIALLDLIAIQYPTYLPSYTKTWLNNFSASDEPIIITSANCTDKNVTNPSFIQCTSQSFTGNSNDNDNNNNNSEINDDIENSKNRKSAIIIIVCSILAGLAGFGLGTWLLLWARKRYGERFIELKDEPEVQSSQVDEEKGNNGGTTN